jgi:hypothetical protein
MITDDVPMCCTVCSSTIVGPLAECVHCPPEQEVRCINCHGEPYVDGHIFRLRMEPTVTAGTQGQDGEERVMSGEEN